MTANHIPGNRQAVPLLPADYIAINQIVQPMQKMPKWIAGIGLGFGVIVTTVILLTDGPIFMAIIASLFGLAIAVIGNLVLGDLLKKVAEDLQSGQKVEIIGILEDTRVHSSNQSSSKSYYWRVDGEEFPLTKNFFQNAQVGQKVRLCHLQRSKLVFVADIYWSALHPSEN